MKIVLIGLGSIGQRHLRNLLHLGYNDVSIVSRGGSLPEEFSSLPVYPSLNEALTNSTFDAAIVCTPTSCHFASVKTLLEVQVPNIYIEKPVSHSLEGMNELLYLSNNYQSNVVVGYDLHFDPGLAKVKDLLLEDAIGKVASINARVGQYLPDWRPKEDYRNGMSARKATGGGVMLDLVHEFDYLLWLNGNVKTIACNYINSGALEIETEDVAEVMLHFKNGSIGSIHLDYLQPSLVRNCLITGFNGSIYWDLSNSSVKWTNRQKKDDVFNYNGFERNQRFINIIKAFLENKNHPALTSLEDGLESLRLVVAAKHSAEREVFVQMEDFKPIVLN